MAKNFIYFGFFTFIFLLFTEVSLAGWTSGGGETIKESQNPWFLENTKEVKYCIQADEQNFGQSIESIRKRVRLTISIWKHQLQNLTYSSINSKQWKLGTQNFIETTCHKDTDLVLQFGVINGDQFRYLADPTKYIGVTVRTEYDTVSLKAKGFMYFSPENGPLKLNKLGLIDNPWTLGNGELLTPALIHEFGHVFGLHHNSAFLLMNETFLESILTAKDPSHTTDNFWSRIENSDLAFQWNFFKYEPIPSTLSHVYRCITNSSSNSTGYSTTSRIINSTNGNTRPFDRFFGVIPVNESESTCINYGITKEDNKYMFKIKQILNSGEIVVLGQAVLEKKFTFHNVTPVVTLWLPKEQNVIIGDEYIRWGERFALAFMEDEALFKGTYKINANSQTRSLAITTKTFGGLKLGGILDGEYYLDLSLGY